MLAAGPSAPVWARQGPRPYDGPMRGPELPIDDLYARLELPSDAAPEAIEIAWRALLKVHHPDVAGEASLEVAKRINIAHDWLADPDLRARYDRSRGGTRAARPAASRWAPPPPRQTRATDRYDHLHEARPRDVGLGSEVVLAFLDRVATLGADEIDRLGLAAPPPLAFVASIRRFLGQDRLTALDGLEALVSHRLPPKARAVPAAHDAVTSYGQYLVLEGFLGDLLSEPFLERVEERMTRGWLAAVGRTRYGPRTADVRSLVARASSLTAQEGSALVTAATALGLTDRLWPHGTDPEEDEVLRVSAALAARDAAAAARAGGATARAQAAVASFSRVLALAPAFGPVETARLMRPWHDLGTRGDHTTRPLAGSGPRRVDHPG
jgi:DnaJ-like protein